MTWRDWLKLILLYVAVQSLQWGIWWWGFTASETVPYDMQRPDKVRVWCFLGSLPWTLLAYVVTLRLLRAGPRSRRLGYVVIAAFLVPALVLAVVARLGGPRFNVLVLQFPYLGASLGLQLGNYQWHRSQSDAEPPQ